MKKFIALLFISLFVSQINAATMSIDLNATNTAVLASGHDHCQGTASVSHAEDGKSSSNASATHYCCAVVAILNPSPIFFSFKQLGVYLHGDVESPTSNIPESIYKPPRNYL